MKKFNFTGETQTLFNGTVLRRIRALVDIDIGWGIVRAGENGGWIESENNLSDIDNSWVHGNAVVYGNAKVSDNAIICGNAKVWGNAVVCGNARIHGDVRVWGDVAICDNAHIYGNAKVWGNGKIGGDIAIWCDECWPVNRIGPDGEFDETVCNV